MASVLIWMLVILFTLNGLRAQSVIQPEDRVTVTEGDLLTVKCTYSLPVSPYLFWYVQYPNQGFQLLLKYITGDNLVKGSYGFEAEFNKSQNSFHLKKQSVLGNDSALYFCAVKKFMGGTEKLTFGMGTQLKVEPIIHQPDPSVYKLRGPKSSNTSVCLLTDFASQDNVTQEMKHMVFRSGSTALDVKAMDSKSNGALAWSNSINFQCNSTFETYAFYPSSEYSCDAKLVEKSFETDMNLNFQNLSVIALRILLLKVAGFNLLMTLRLWSS